MPTKSKTKAKPKATADTPACVICMTVPPAGQGAHHCSTCTAGAWVVCAGCEEAIKGKKCPICRGDYMREAASGWDALPASTTTLELDEQPTQDELKRISARFPQLEQLMIGPECEYSDEPEEQLDFAADGVHFPALTRLQLTCVGLRSISFTEQNTPRLEHLELSNVQGECCPFHLALPRLRVLDAEHTMLGERHIDAGQFGLSLSRCPRLEVVTSYKFRCLGDCNYAVLPSLTSLRLHRSECTSHLDILYAPKLREVSLQAAYELRAFKLRNLPSASVATVEALLATKLAAEEAAREEARAEDRRWRDQTNVKALTKEARRRGWIEKGEKWQVAAEPPSGGGDFVFEAGDDMSDMMDEFDAYEEVLQEHVSELFQKKADGATEAAEAELLGASVADASLPRVTIDATNMDGFRLSSLEPQVRSRCKVRKAAGGGWGFGGSPYGSEEEGEEEGDDEDDEDDEDEDGEGGVHGFMREMMATGMMGGMGFVPGFMPGMIPGRMGSSGPPPDVLQRLTAGLPPGVRVNVQGGRSFTTGGGAAPAPASGPMPRREPQPQPRRSRGSTRPKRGRSSAVPSSLEAAYHY